MKLLNKVKRLFRLLLSMIPTPLPQGMSEFDTWADSIIDIAQFPTMDVDSIKFAMATMIMHMGPTTASKPKYYFILAIKAGASKQVTSGVFQNIKIKQQAAAKAEQEKQQAEATA